MSNLVQTHQEIWVIKQPDELKDPPIMNYSTIHAQTDCENGVKKRLNWNRPDFKPIPRMQSRIISVLSK